MFYYFRPEGFRSMVNGTLGFSSQYHWSRCDIGFYSDAQAWWEKEIGPYTKGLDTSSMLVVPNFSFDTMAKYRNKFYGGFLRGNGIVVPDPVVVKSSNKAPQRRPGSYKAYKAARDSGKILLNPIERFSFEGSCTAGLPHPISGGARRTYGQGHTNFMSSLWSKVPNACPAQTGTKWLFQPSELIDHNGPRGTEQTYREYAVQGNLAVPLSATDMLEWFSEFREAVSSIEVSKSLVTQARAEARSGVLDLTTTLAELPETLKMIFEALRLLLTKYLEVKRKVDILRENKVNQADLVSQVSALWMQYRYGIMPNVYMIQDGLKYIDASLVEYITVRAGEQLEVPLPEWRGWSTSSGVPAIERVFLKNRIDIDSLTKQTAFLKTDILSTAWELIPLSFVIDWALNIGDFLSSLSAPTGSVQEAAQRSIQVKPVTLSLTNPDFPGAVFTATVGIYSSELIQPSDHIGLAFDLTLTLKRKLDALALLWGATKSDFKRNVSKRIS